MKKERRYDIDWIRVIVFDILIFYHVGMFFVPWPWHIKNNELLPALVLPMLFVNQWRIPILFVISGMGTRFALSYRSGKVYIKERLYRLFIPLLVGILVVVPPQVYLERLVEGKVALNFLQYYPQTFNGIYPSGNFSWHHLWFLPYLLLMSIIATPIFLAIRKPDNAWLFKLSELIKRAPFALYLFVIPLFFIEWSLASSYPITHALIGDWYALAYYFSLFIFGYVLISIGTNLWLAFDQLKWPSFVIGILCFILIWYSSGYDFPSLFSFVKTVNCWAWILCIFGFAAKYLNRKSALITYRNQAVYPFYILHQTITIILGYFLMDSALHFSLKMLVMVAGTFLISWALYEYVIKRISILRPFFGLKESVQ